MGLREQGLLEITTEKVRQDLQESQQGVFDEDTGKWINAEVFV